MNGRTRQIDYYPGVIRAAALALALLGALLLAALLPGGVPAASPAPAPAVPPAPQSVVPPASQSAVPPAPQSAVTPGAPSAAVSSSPNASSSPEEAAVQSGPALWQSACRQYQEGRFIQARRSFEALRSQGVADPDLYFNLGNTYYQLGEKGRAAWMYEKALAVAPRHSDARRNLALARGGKVEDAGVFFLFKPLSWLCGRLTAGEWAGVFLALSLLLALAAVPWIILGPESVARRAAAVAACAAGGLLLIAAAFLVPRCVEAEWRHYGVVVEAGAVVRNAPADDARKYFEAAQGERFEVWESDSAGWVKVKHPATGRSGYLPEKALGKI